MDRNSTIGLLLIGAIVIGYAWFTRPTEAEIEAHKRYTDSIAEVQKFEEQTLKAAELKMQDSLAQVQQASFVALDSTGTATDSVLQAKQAELTAMMENKAMQDRFGIFAAAAEGTEKVFTVENELIKATFSNKGGRLIRAELKNFKQYYNKDQNVTLFDADSSAYHVSFKEQNGMIRSLDDLYFTTEGADVQLTGEEEKEIRFRLSPQGNPTQYVEYVYSFKGNEYMLDFDVQFVGLDHVVDKSSIKLDWDMLALSNEKSVDYERTTSSVFFKYKEESRDYLSEQADDALTLEQETEWVCFKAHFFSVILLSDAGFKSRDSEIEIQNIQSQKYIERYQASLGLPVEEGKVAMRMYLGPNDVDILEDYGHQLYKVPNIGWGIFGWLNRWFVYPLFNFISSIGIGTGLAIILLTLLIKVLLFPIYYRSLVSGARMRVLKPEIAEINKKFPKKEDAVKKQQEMMALYRQTGVSPMSGCIPPLLQMPLLYAMFRFFPSAIQLRGESFLWADDLSTYDAVLTWTTEIPMLSSIYGNHMSLFTILMCASTFLYTRMSSSNMPQQEGMPNMQVMFYIFPFMMLFFFNKFASGLALYYFLANLMSMGQMFIVKKYMIDEGAIRASLEENKKKPKKKSKFAERLEAAAKAQQARQRGK